MPFCSTCGAKLNDGAKFCCECGAALAVNQGNTKRTTEYEGEIHKCPNCGETLNSFVSNCPVCGYELRNNHSSNSITAFSAKLNEIDSKCSQKGKTTKAYIEKINLIKQFTIPNNKEDITEFFMLAYSNIDTDVYGLKGNSPALISQRKVSDAWLLMFHQAYQKALIVFGTSTEFATIRNLHDDLCKEVKKKKRQLPIYFTVSVIVAIILFVLFGYLLTNANAILN